MSDLPNPFKAQLDRILLKLGSGPTHASGPRKPNLTQLETLPDLSTNPMDEVKS